MRHKISLLFLFAMLFSACSNEVKEKSSNISEKDIFKNTKVAVYYMHGKMRCVTCNELERVSKETIEEAYADNKEVKFYSIDFSKSENREISDKYEVAFSSLIVTTKDEHVNLSMEAFPLVFSDNEELKNLIITEVNSYLNN